MSDYNYRHSLKSNFSDELINIYVIRPLAGILVRWLYRAPVTPNQVTVAALLAGLLAAWLYGQGTAQSTLMAGIFVSLKDVLDSADGQLARAKKLFSRRGRFLDSIGDIVVTGALFAGIGLALYGATKDHSVVFLSVASAVGMTLRVSYHVFYHVSYLHMHNLYTVNRLFEDITEEDRQADRLTLMLQQTFLALYGWQDRLMARIDAWCGGQIRVERYAEWYGDRAAMRLSGFLGYGTELFLLMIASVANKVGVYLWVNVVGMNLLFSGAIAYRRWILRRRLELKRRPEAAGGGGSGGASHESLQ
jgi:phosphatidylglycerophosphate synthase